MKARCGPRIIFEAVSSDYAKMSDYIGVAGWNKPLAVSNDLTLVMESWPQYQPRRERI